MYTYSVTCDLPTLVRLATGQLPPASALLTGAVRLKGDRGALRGLAAPMAAAGKGVAAEFPQLFAVVARKGRRRKRGGKEERAEALLLPEGASDCLSDCLSWGLAVWRDVVVELMQTIEDGHTADSDAIQPIHLNTHAYTTALSRGLFVERRLWEDDAARDDCALCLRVSRVPTICAVCCVGWWHAMSEYEGRSTCGGWLVAWSVGASIE